MKTTITYDTEQYKLVPIKSNDTMACAGIKAHFEDPARINGTNYWDRMIAAVLANLPGVVTHSGEIAAWKRLNFGIASVLTNWEKDDPKEHGINPDFAAEHTIPLFTHPASDAPAKIIHYPDGLDTYPALEPGEVRYIEPAPDALAIVKATLEAAAKVAEEINDCSEVGDALVMTAENIRAIDPQAILDSVKK